MMKYIFGKYFKKNLSMQLYINVFWNIHISNVVFRSLPKPCLNVSPYNFATIVKYPKAQSVTIDSIYELIKQVMSQNIETSTAALSKFNKMLLEPNVRYIKIIIFKKCIHYLLICIFNENCR